jgi:hypothetical protein
MNPTYKTLPDGDACECQHCFAVVRNNPTSRSGHGAWHKAQLDMQVKVLDALRIPYQVHRTAS